MLRPQEHPARLGRFQIVRRLGRGAQGEVYLAEDTRLRRMVAIKTLRLVAADPEEQLRRTRALLAEAQIVSQLSHPGIVPLFDAGEEGGAPYLVFEYVEGETLAARLRRAGPLPAAEAVDLAVQVLKALGHAHARGVLHRDIKPGNVMLSGGVARIMDFGIAQAVQMPATGAEPFSGTPAYLAPEYIAGTPYTTRCDLFSTGMLLYEMLAGTPAVQGETPFEVLHRQVTEPFAPPSVRNGEVDERLDGLVLRAIAKQPDERFPTAASMEDALYVYLNPDSTAETDATAGADTAQGKQATLQFLLRRMRHKSDFPALSSMISAVNRAAGSETERVSEISNSILRDFALTNKLLKLVNAAHYGQFSGTISTISRASVILGFENVRQVAVTLLLFEHLQNKSQAARLRDEMLASYFSGLLARGLVKQAGIRDAEEAFICALFQSLGKLLTAFYFDEEFQEIGRLQQAQGLDPAHASARVLGLTFEELGIGVGKAWHFPARLVQSMRSLGPEKPQRPATGEERLRLIASLASELAAVLREHSAEARADGIKRLAARYDNLGVSEKLIAGVAETAAAELANDSSMLGIAEGTSPLLARLARSAADGGTQDSRLQTLIGEATRADADAAAATAGAATPAERQAILSAGIQDITNSLAGDYELNDILRIILETMYRAIGFTRVLLCVRDARSNTLRGRFGLGADVDRILQRGFQIPLATQARDAFQAAVDNGSDIYIENVNAERIREHIPEWYRKLVAAQSLALFPVMVNKKAVGLFYGDSDQPGRLTFAPSELNLLKTLRNQAVLAIRQRG